MDFLLVVLVTTVLYVRPAELIPSLVTVPFFELAIIPALVVASPKIAVQFSAESLRRHPITACVLGLFAASKLSHALNGQIEDLFDVEFAKVVLYYLLVVSVLDTPRRVRRFMASIVVLLTFSAYLIQGDLYGWFDIPTIEPMYEYMSDVPRVCGTGLLGDPNDLGINMSLAIILALAMLTQRGSGFLRALWAGPIYVLFTTLRLTQSRGALLALLGGLGMLLVQRLGLVRGALVAAVALPIMVTTIGGRQANITTSGGTGQARVQLWAAALDLMRGPALLVGVGPGHLTDYQNQVAHNGFVQAYSEIGLIGGGIFLAMFLCAGVSMYRLRGKDVRVSCPEARGMISSLGAGLACYALGLMSLSQTFYLLSYVILALTTAVAELADPYPRPAIMTLDGRLAARLPVVGIAGFIFFKVYVMYAVRW